MSLTLDLGEVIKNHVYIREIYSTNQKERCLFSTDSFLKKLGKVYDCLGIHWRTLQELNVRVKLPDNHNQKYRDYWNETIIRESDQKASITEINRYSGYYNKEVILASSAWMGEFETFPGDEVIISPFPNLILSSSAM